ncbi:hypothetical protein KY289_006013 [Solanum tuberosum]|nr:hypothetical protein KY289_006013 [Solanum tuberosum]
MEELNALINNTFQTLNFFPTLSYLNSTQKISFIPKIPQKVLNTLYSQIPLKERENNNPKGKETSILDLIRKKQSGTGGHFDKSWGTKYRDVHLGDTLLQRVRRAHQHDNSSLLLIGDEKMHFEPEEREGTQSCNSGTKPYWNTQAEISSGEREREGLAGASNTTQLNDELYHIERDGRE